MKDPREIISTVSLVAVLTKAPPSRIIASSHTVETTYATCVYAVCQRK